MKTTALFRARDFAERAGVTVRTLHHYDWLGLLKPSRYTQSGHRLYGEGELARLQQIVTLKFIGLPLKQIKEVLSENELDLTKTLRLQRELIVEKRRHLDAALEAIERAERMVATNGEPDWGAFKNIMEVINMQKNMEWVKKYYTQEQLAELGKRWSPELQEKASQDWTALIKDVEAAINRGENPASENAKKLAARWSELIEAFTGGDPAIAENLKRLYADQANWPSDFQKPYGDEVGSFIIKVMEANKGKRN
ncbi:MAG: MerR family transcriptional regulator [Pyrinomonadaceae bacterium]|nr:MerR family transcriptional regulator [Pyrinomonadaceae bacterium]